MRRLIKAITALFIHGVGNVELQVTRDAAANALGNAQA
jgi:hypothetical protein